MTSLANRIFPKLNKTGQVKRITNTYSIRGYCQRTPFSCEFPGKNPENPAVETLPQNLTACSRESCDARSQIPFIDVFTADFMRLVGIAPELWSRYIAGGAYFFNFCFGNCCGDMRINCGVYRKSVLGDVFRWLIASKWEVSDDGQSLN